MLMTREENINKYTRLAGKYMGKVRELQEQENDEVARPMLRESVGKCFRYEDSYGVGEKWPIFIKIVDFDEKNLTFNTIQFQHTSRKIVEIQYENVYNFRGKNYFNERDYTPITLQEYNSARKNALRFVNNLLTDRR